MVDHANGLTSHYAHLHVIARGIRPGARITQKTVIGQVGATGRATGPHLHLGIKRNGSWVDPERLKFSRNDPVPSHQRAAFEVVVQARMVRIAAMRLPEDEAGDGLRLAQLDAGGGPAD